MLHESPWIQSPRIFWRRKVVGVWHNGLSRSGSIVQDDAPSLSTLCDDVDGSDGKSCQHLSISAPCFVPPLFRALTTCSPAILSRVLVPPRASKAGISDKMLSGKPQVRRLWPLRRVPGHDHDLDWASSVPQSDRRWAKGRSGSLTCSYDQRMHRQTDSHGRTDRTDKQTEINTICIYKHHAPNNFGND